MNQVGRRKRPLAYPGKVTIAKVKTGLYFKRRYGNEPGSSGNDGGAGTGGGTPAGGAAGGQGNGQQQQQQSQAPAGITPEIQAWVASEAQRLTNLAATTVRQQEQQKYEKAQADATAAAAAAEAVKKGEFEALYKGEQTAHAATKVTADRVTTLSTAVHAGIDAEIANWAAEVKALDPGKDAPAETRLQWVTNARALAAKLAGTPAGRQAPNGEHGNGGGRQQQQQNDGSSTVKDAYTNYVKNTYHRPDEKP